jgi:twitching motility protein PilT
MLPNPAIRNLIREDKIHQIYGVMQAGQAKYGMQTFNQSLSELVLKGEITQEQAFDYSSNTDELRELINRGVGTSVSGGRGGAQPAPTSKPASPLTGGRNPNIKYT